MVADNSFWWFVSFIFNFFLIPLCLYASFGLYSISDVVEYNDISKTVTKIYNNV